MNEMRENERAALERFLRLRPVSQQVQELDTVMRIRRRIMNEKQSFKGTPRVIKVPKDLPSVRNPCCVRQNSLGPSSHKIWNSITFI